MRRWIFAASMLAALTAQACTDGSGSADQPITADECGAYMDRTMELTLKQSSDIAESDISAQIAFNRQRMSGLPMRQGGSQVRTFCRGLKRHDFDCVMNATSIADVAACRNGGSR